MQQSQKTKPNQKVNKKLQQPFKFGILYMLSGKFTGVCNYF